MYPGVGSKEGGMGGYQGQLDSGDSIVLAEAIDAAWFGDQFGASNGTNVKMV